MKRKLVYFSLSAIAAALIPTLALSNILYASQEKSFVVADLPQTGGVAIRVREDASTQEGIIYGLVGAPASGSLHSYDMKRGNVDIDTRSHTNAVAIGVRSGESLYFQGAGSGKVTVLGHSALQNQGTFALLNIPDVVLHGKVISNGKFTVLHSAVALTGTSHIKDLQLAGASLRFDVQDSQGNTIRKGTAVVENLFLQKTNTASSITVNGYRSDDPTAADMGAKLVIHKIAERSEGSIAVNGNGVLGLGALDPDQFAHMIAMSALQGSQGDKPTLITVGTSFDLSFSSIMMGPTADLNASEAGTVVFSGPSRWIVDLGAQGSSGKPLAVTGTQNTDLVVWGWNGVSTVLDLQYSGWQKVILAGTDYRGMIGYDDKGNIQIDRYWLWQLPDYAGSSMTRAVEERTNEANEKEYRPGWRFLVDGLSPDRVGDGVYVNVMESGIFLPAASGVLQALERADQLREEEVLLRTEMTAAGDTMIWAAAWNENRTAKEVFSGASGRFGFHAATNGGMLGFDHGINADWTVGAAVSLSSTDVRGRGVGPNVWGDGTMASVTGFAKYRMPQSLLTLAVSASQLDTTGKLLANEHRLQADSKSWLASVSMRWELSSWSQWLTPALQFGLYGMRLKDGLTNDSFGAISGNAFTTKADDRYWGRVGGDITARKTWQCFGVEITPRIQGAMHMRAGALDWEVHSTLVDGPGASRSYEGASRWDAQLGIGVHLLKSGSKQQSSNWFSFYSKDKPEQLMVPYRWELDLQAKMQWGAQGDRATVMGAKAKMLY